MKGSLKILSTKEVKSFDSYPQYTPNQRRDNFRIGSRLKILLKHYKGTSKVHFFIRLTYFKTNYKFYQTVSRKDLIYVAKILGIDEEKILSGKMTRQTIEAHHRSILKLCNFKVFNSKAEKIAIAEIEQLLKLHKRPRTLWSCLLDFLIDHKIEIPEYRKLEAVIIKAKLSHVETNKETSKKLTRKQKSIIKTILAQEVTKENKDKPGLVYEISRMKKINQSQKVSDTRETIEQYRQFKKYYLLY